MFLASRGLLLLVALIVVWASPTSVCAQPATEPPGGLTALLSRPVLSEGRTLAEVKVYCNRRIVVRPQPSSWSSWLQEAEKTRRNVLDNVVFPGVPSSWRGDKRRVEWLETISGGPEYNIKKLRYEALP